MSDPRDVLVSQSPPMRELALAIDRVAAAEQPAIVLGEAGTGRELVARLIHARSPRRRRPLVTVSAGGGPRALVEGALEGSSMDAFERARGGCLLLKDVGELSRMAQRKLSRLLGDQGAGYDVRVIATAEPSLERIAEAEMWNQLLFERLSVWTLVVPPLRDRAEDVAPLADRFLRQYCKELGRARVGLGAAAAARLAAYAWPGNVAELKQVVRRIAIGVRGRSASETDVDAVLPALAIRVPAGELSLEELVKARLSEFLRRVEGYSLTGVHGDIMGQVERPLIALVLEHAGGNQLRAAEILGLSRNTLRKKLGDHGLGAVRPRARARR